MSERLPAQCSPVREFITEELEARGQTLDEAINCAFQYPHYAMRNVAKHYIEPLLDPSSDERELSPIAAMRLGQVFGTSADIWMNINALYIRWRQWKRDTK